MDEIKTGETTSLYKIQHPLKFVRNNARGSQSKTYGYEATLLLDLCDVIIKAGESELYLDLDFAIESKAYVSSGNPDM